MTSKTVNDSHHLYLDNYMGYIRFLLGNRSGAWRPFQIRGEIGCTPGGYRDNTDCEPFTLRKSATLIGSFTPNLKDSLARLETVAACRAAPRHA